MTQARTLGELKKSGVKAVPVKEEMRRNLIRKLESGETLFPGILGYDDSVVPQVANAVLSRHNMILLGLRDQAVPATMIVYAGYGHGITKPKSNRAVLQHNLDWFAHYIWGEPLAAESPLRGRAEAAP